MTEKFRSALSPNVCGSNNNFDGRSPPNFYSETELRNLHKESVRMVNGLLELSEIDSVDVLAESPADLIHTPNILQSLDPFQFKAEPTKSMANALKGIPGPSFIRDSGKRFFVLQTKFIFTSVMNAGLSSICCFICLLIQNLIIRRVYDF
eukprot:UN30699